MATLKLPESLRQYKNNWVALDDNDEVVAFAKTFAGLMKKVENNNEEVTVMRASDNYGNIIA